MAKWVRLVVFRAVLVFASVLAVTTACSNMFSQAEADRVDIGFEFRANMLFSEQGAASVGVPYLIPTADRIEARLTGADGSDVVPPVVQPLERVSTDNHAVATVVEFESVPVNIAYTISLRIFSSADPGKTLHSGSADIAPITGTEREKEVTVRLDPGVVESTPVEAEGADVSVNLNGGAFILYRLDSAANLDHIVRITGEYAEVQYVILDHEFRRTDSSFTDNGSELTATIPQSEHARYLALYNDVNADPVALTVALQSEGAPALPPDAPTDMIVEITAENTFNVYWTDNSSTETGFRIYEDDGVTRQQLGADHAAGTTSVANQSSTFALPVDDFTLEVVAFNQFGESAPLSFTFRLLQAAQFPNFQNSINTNSPLWAAAANPGSVNWNTMIVGGGSAVNLYLDTADISDPIALPAPTLLGAPPHDLTVSGPFTPGATYSWRVETVGDVGNEGRVIYPVETLTIRDGNLYVATTGNVGAAGSTAAPFDSIHEAIALAEIGETINIAAGSYSETGGVTVDKTLAIEGSWDPTFAFQDLGTQLTTITSPTPVDGSTLTVTGASADLRNLRIELDNPSVATNFAALTVTNNAGVTIEQSRIAVVQSAGTFAYALRLNSTAGNVTIRGSEIQAAETTNVLTAEGISIVGTYTGLLTVGGPAPADGNTFLATGGPNSIHHIRVNTGTPVSAPIITIENNTFESISGTGNNWQHSVYSQSAEANIDISNNAFFGHTNVGTNSLWAIRIGSDGNITVQNNRFIMDTDLDSPVTAIEIEAGMGAGSTTINANKVRMAGGDAQTNTGMRVLRTALISNNIVVQEGTSAGTGIFQGVESEGENTKILHNIFYDQNTSVLGNLVRLPAGNNQIVTNNILLGPGVSPTAGRGLFISGTALVAEVNSNAFWGLTSAIENDIGGAFVDPTATDLNLRAFAAGNADSDPNLDLASSITETTWYKPGVIIVGDDYLVDVPQDINGSPRVNPPHVGAYEN